MYTNSYEAPQGQITYTFPLVFRKQEKHVRPNETWPRPICNSSVSHNTHTHTKNPLVNVTSHSTYSKTLNYSLYIFSSTCLLRSIYSATFPSSFPLHYLALYKLFSVVPQWGKFNHGTLVIRSTKAQFWQSNIDTCNILPGTIQPGRGSKMCVKVGPTHTPHTQSSLPHHIRWYHTYNSLLTNNHNVTQRFSVCGPHDYQNTHCQFKQTRQAMCA